MFSKLLILTRVILCISGQQFGFPESVEDNTNRDVNNIEIKNGVVI